MLIIGRNPVIEALEFNPGSIKKIVIQEDASDKKVMEIVRISGRKKIPVEKKSKSEFRKLFDEKNKSEGISQGIVALSEDFVYSNLEKVIEAAGDVSTLVILDEIQDPHNLGAIIRTAAASGADAVIISEKNSAKVTHTVIKSSAGAVNYIPIVQVSNIYKTLMILKDKGYTVVGTHVGSKQLYSEYSFADRSAIIFGNEGSGIRKNILKLCDELLYIPVSRRVQSLNVSVAAGVLLYEILRQQTVRKLL